MRPLDQTGRSMVTLMVQEASKSPLPYQDSFFRRSIKAIRCPFLEGFSSSYLCSCLLPFTSNLRYLKLYSNLDSTNKDIGDVNVENRRLYAYLINENLIFKNCPTVLACSFEFQNMKVKSQKESETLADIKKDDFVKELIPKF